ncbi:alpha/beta fold hydrolase [Saccharopolyspora hirsuta]|uniref:alpha/beta fold hydrolase n=1 Tax=Saccharopolyspora hirsuta TaxID=1837 RepID=UPI00369F2B88
MPQWTDAGSSTGRRALIPRLADRYHVIAPDHVGFGFSDAPPVEEFEYTFDALAELTAGLLDQLGACEYAIYVLFETVLGGHLHAEQDHLDFSWPSGTVRVHPADRRLRNPDRFRAAGADRHHEGTVKSGRIRRM